VITVAWLIAFGKSYLKASGRIIDGIPEFFIEHGQELSDYISEKEWFYWCVCPIKLIEGIWTTSGELGEKLGGDIIDIWNKEINLVVNLTI